MTDATESNNVLIYACSGGSNVAEAADQAARQLAEEGVGSMFCMAGVGAAIPSMLGKARNASRTLILDGCPNNCGRRIAETQNLPHIRHVRITELGIEKNKGRATQADIAKVHDAARAALAED